MFKETGTSFSPLSRKRFASSPSTSHQLSPRFGRKATVPGPKPSRLPLSGGRKKVDPQAKALLSDLTSPQELIDEQCSLSLKDKVKSCQPFSIQTHSFYQCAPPPPPLVWQCFLHLSPHLCLLPSLHLFLHSYLSFTFSSLSIFSILFTLPSPSPLPPLHLSPPLHLLPPSSSSLCAVFSFLPVCHRRLHQGGLQ